MSRVPETLEVRRERMRRFRARLNADPLRRERYLARMAEINRIAYRADPRRGMLQNALKRALHYDVPFNLSIDDISIPEVCPVLLIPLKISNGVRSDSSPSLDRIRPELGYVPGNIQVISCKANTIKNNGSPEDVMRVALWMWGRT